MKIGIIFIEIGILLLVISKRHIILKKDIFVNIIIFMIYNLYLYLFKNTNMYEIYFKHLKKKINTNKINTKKKKYFTNLLSFNKNYILIITMVLFYKLFHHKLT